MKHWLWTWDARFCTAVWSAKPGSKDYVDPALTGVPQVMALASGNASALRDAVKSALPAGLGYEQFLDAVMAQLGLPDMRLPIQYALTYPSREQANFGRMDFRAGMNLSFEAPDMLTFRGLPLAYEAGKAGGTMPCVLNGANEEAVAAFLAGRGVVPSFTDESWPDYQDSAVVVETPDGKRGYGVIRWDERFEGIDLIDLRYA